eukprot:UN28320
MPKILTTRHLNAKIPYFSIIKLWVPHHMENCFKYKKSHFYTRFPHGTQEILVFLDEKVGIMMSLFQTKYFWVL